MKLLKNIRRHLFGEDWGPESVKVPAKWRKARGKGVTVLVIDSGVPFLHGGLTPYIAEDRNFVWNETIDDSNGHATAVCGIIRDWAPSCDIVCYKAMDKSGHSDGCMNVLAALRAAVLLQPAVVNLSLAAYRGASRLHEPIQDLVAGGSVVVAGTGNDPTKGTAYPARWDEVVAVGASNRKGEVADFSAPGADIIMPGVDIRVHWLRGSLRISSGTSLASAAATGLLALAMSAGLDSMDAREAVFGIVGRRAGA